jgi:predicted RNA-binding Zn-ribbon protein involved in translation (DUF1610 family)
MRYVPPNSGRPNDYRTAKASKDSAKERSIASPVTKFMEENRSDGHSSRDTILCPSCGEQMVLVDVTQRIKGERLTFRCPVCREIIIRNSDEAKVQVDQK